MKKHHKLFKTFTELFEHLKKIKLMLLPKKIDETYDMEFEFNKRLSKTKVKIIIMKFLQKLVN